MPVFDQVKKLFQKTPESPLSESTSAVSGAPDVEDDRTAIMESVEVKSVNFPESRMGEMAAPEPVDIGDRLALPLLGYRPIGQHQQILAGLLGFSLLLLAVVTFFALSRSDMVAQQVAATGQSLMQSQRLAKSVSQALVGSPQAFPDVKESVDVLARTVRGLKDGNLDLRLDPVSTADQEDLSKVVPFVDRAEKSANTVMGQQKTLTQVGAALRTINRQSSDLLEIAETISSLKLQQNAPPTDISAAGDADPADRQVRERIPDHGRREPGGCVPAGQGSELLPGNRTGVAGGKSGAASVRHQGSPDP
jgi:twitching motility protein PilJ